MWSQVRWPTLNDLKFNPRSFGQKIINPSNQPGQLNLYRVHLFPTCALKLDAFDDFAHIMGMRWLSVLGKITHLQFPGLLINPDEALFELILEGPVFNILKIPIFFPVAFDHLI